MSTSEKEAERERDERAEVLDAAWHCVWLHGDWERLTREMTTSEREAAADAVGRHARRLEPDEPAVPERWWRNDAASSVVLAVADRAKGRTPPEDR